MSSTQISLSNGSPLDANQINRPKRADGTGVTAASVFALWILFPLALGALAYVLVGAWLLMSPTTNEFGAQIGITIDLVPWLGLTLLLQAGYWAVIASRAGRQPLLGLWALLPIVALIPTFGLARDILLKDA